MPESEIVRFFGAVADAASLPIAVKNNPVNMDVWLSNPSLLALHHHPNVSLLKGEGAASWVQRLIEATGGSLDVFAGLAGIERIANLESGCVEADPGPRLRRYPGAHPRALAKRPRTPRRRRNGSTRVLPLIVFMTRNLQTHQLAVGKRFVAKLGSASRRVHVRTPAATPTPFQLREVARIGDWLGPLGGERR
ncbi:MAG: hypothetical protein R3D25_13390 [Geminicoccaceae bacterium]